MYFWNRWRLCVVNIIWLRMRQEVIHCLNEMNDMTPIRKKWLIRPKKMCDLFGGAQRKDKRVQWKLSVHFQSRSPHSIGLIAWKHLGKLTSLDWSKMWYNRAPQKEQFVSITLLSQSKNNSGLQSIILWVWQIQPLNFQITLFLCIPFIVLLIIF